MVEAAPDRELDSLLLLLLVLLDDTELPLELLGLRLLLLPLVVGLGGSLCVVMGASLSASSVGPSVKHIVTGPGAEWWFLSLAVLANGTFFFLVVTFDRLL